MFLEVSSTILGMDTEARARAAAAFRKAMAGRSAQYVADLAGIPDPATVRNFANGDTWPWAKTRKRLEEAVGMAPGELEAIARGDVLDEDERDPVVVAIEQSELSRANRAKLIGTYYEMLDAQAEGRRVG